MNYRLIDFKIIGDERGKLVALEQNKEIPFNIKRIYYIYDTKQGQERGKHAHTRLEQVMIALNGSCTFVLDDGKVREEVCLDSPDFGLYIGKNIWREMKDFSSGCVLLGLVNEYYDENEYIRDYEKSLKEVNK